ncbi:MAG: HAMP domain-containing histidine kinase [Ruminococcaceae bacterium]|nr:HAMP domain-containing histidine kinase [Oscillospiraceae bacterium]
MPTENKVRTPRRTTLFFKYFRITMAIILVTIMSIGIVFLIFLTNYWTVSSVTSLKSNAKSIASTAEALFINRKMETDSAESNLILCNSLSMVSASINADVFMTDATGKIILCKDHINAKMEVINDGKCPVHDGYKMPERIVAKLKEGGYHTLDTLTDPHGKLYVVVGEPIEYEGKTVGAIFAVAPVLETLGPYTVEIFKLFGGASTVSIVLAIILIYVFSYRLTKPLEEMSRITKLYARGDFSQRIILRGNDELTDLARNLNAMGRSLSVLEDSRRSFVANVSHELKTPMTSISGFIDGILDGTISPSEEKAYLRIVSDEVKRLSSLVMTMLMLSKIEAGEEELELEETEINELLFDALLNFEKSIEEAKIKVEGFEKMKRVKVFADEKMLYQVVYNLYDNALKFTNVGGTIEVGLEERQDRAYVSISNTGEGIMHRELERVFERFYKTDKSRSQHVEGVGLGLNLVKNIVELHGGEVSVSSDPGLVTTFSFWIPKNQ